ncbi:large subunit GTPase 1 homolog [Saccostrea echinata]|uniref:large subunit GTPase 1 homolog n=1 Tax=Saccostrea echinata TaxID=191078 RepID=UPI002A82F347|nr:large subunit GTPase 1 homolog [Saccostrea echinata]
MGRKKTGGNLGKSLIKDRFGKKNILKRDDSFLHTSELQDGYDWGRLNLQSVTEQSNLDDFLATAELAGTEFTAEKLNIQFVDPHKHTGLKPEELDHIKQLHKEHETLLRIPRRPLWDETTTAEQLDQMERESFLQWRRGLSALQEIEGIIMTPYEKNLEFWRQLWRVIERSDIIVQVVDARNPLLYQCNDLEQYVKEVDTSKVNILLINKADFLSYSQRQMWKEYFDKVGTRVAFWSALEESERHERAERGEEVEEMLSNSEEEDTSEEEDIECYSDKLEENVPGSDEVEVDDHKDILAEETSCPTSESPFDHIETNSGSVASGGARMNNSVKVLNAEELLDYFRSVHREKKVTDGQTTVGMIGYPNVGKSSTINAILKTKKVPVSSTPGRTKHFQTLYVESDLMLCDCPGLVFPSFVSTKAELIVNGILPIDQMRDHWPPVNLVCSYIQRETLEALYGINLPPPPEGEDPNRWPTAEELLTTYGSMRGYMSVNGIPDCPRTARYILKDFVNGRLLYCHPPPDVDEKNFQLGGIVPKDIREKQQSILSKKKPKEAPARQSKLDKDFFQKLSVGMHSKGMVSAQQSGGATYGGNSVSSSMMSVAGKPWKKHNNKGKREKLRRLYKDGE